MNFKNVLCAFIVATGYAQAATNISTVTPVTIVDGATNSTDYNMDSAGTFTIASGTGTLSGDITGSGAITKSGWGTLVLTGDNSGSTSAMTISQGTLEMGAANALPTGTINTGNNATFALFDGADVSNALSLGSYPQYFYVDEGESATLSGTISVTGSSAILLKHGDGELILNQDNSAKAFRLYTNTGTLTLDSTNTLPLASGSILWLGGGTLKINADITTPSMNFTIKPEESTTIDVVSGNTLTFGMAVSNATSGGKTHTKTGLGTWSLTGDSSATTRLYSLVLSQGILSINAANNFGIVALSGGTLNVRSDVTLPDSKFTLLDGGTTTIDVEGGVTLTLSEAIGGTSAGVGSGTHTFIKTGAGTLSLTGDNKAILTSLTLNGGTVSIDNTNNLGSLTYSSGTLYDREASAAVSLFSDDGTVGSIDATISADTTLFNTTTRLTGGTLTINDGITFTCAVSTRLYGVTVDPTV